AVHVGHLAREPLGVETLQEGGEGAVIPLGPRGALLDVEVGPDREARGAALDPREPGLLRAEHVRIELAGLGRLAVGGTEPTEGPGVGPAQVREEGVEVVGHRGLATGGCRQCGRAGRPVATAVNARCEPRSRPGGARAWPAGPAAPSCPDPAYGR